MADATTARGIYPPNFDGFFDPDEKRGLKYLTGQIMNISDGTGEDSVRKLARKDLYGPAGQQCKRICIEEISYNTTLMGAYLFFDMTPIEVIAVIPQEGSGIIKGPFLPSVGKNEDYEPGETGDLMLTTIGHESGGTYDITIKVRIKET